MFCRHCGIEIPDDSKFCVGCGKKIDEEMSEFQDVSIRIHPPGLTSDYSIRDQLFSEAPEAFKKAQKILVQTSKFNRGAGLFQSKEKKKEASVQVSCDASSSEFTGTEGWIAYLNDHVAMVLNQETKREYFGFRQAKIEELKEFGKILIGF